MNLRTYARSRGEAAWLAFRRAPLWQQVAVVFLALCFVDEALALARPGGGSSFRSGSSSSRSSSGSSRSSSSSSSSSSSRSSGSSGGGSGAGLGDLFSLVWLLFRLVVDVPVLGVPLLIGGLFFLFLMGRSAKQHKGMRDWSSGHGVEDEPPGPSPRRELEGLRAVDPNFSVVLLEDFLYALFAEVHSARGRGQIDRFSPYLAPTVLELLRAQAPGEVRSIVVGALRYEDVDVGSGDGNVTITVAFEANYEEGPPGQKGRAYYVEQLWTLTRKRTALSRTPDKTRVFGCPSCGAPLEQTIAGQCRYCNRVTNTGELDWLVETIDETSREERGPMLTGTVEEQGTNLPTVVDPEAAQRLRDLEARDPSFQWGTFQGRVGLVFQEFQIGWSGRDLSRMRPFLSDNLFQTQVYWIETYIRQSLRNVTERARITGIELSRVTTDRFFDAITVRVRATGLDYTVTDDGKVVAGSKSKERAYTEYWTFIRGSSRKGPTHTAPECPNCGAPLRINMAASCEYCHVKVNSGEFDWVLSRIEQDEVYQ